MGRSWATHGQVMGKSWASHGQVMGKSKANHGQLMGESWAKHWQLTRRRAKVGAPGLDGTCTSIAATGRGGRKPSSLASTARLLHTSPQRARVASLDATRQRSKLLLQLLLLVPEVPPLRAWELLLPQILASGGGTFIVGSAVGRSLRFIITLPTILATPATHCRFLLAPAANPLRTRGAILRSWTGVEQLLGSPAFPVAVVAWRRMHPPLTEMRSGSVLLSAHRMELFSARVERTRCT